eukprot:gene14504-19471_t
MASNCPKSTSQRCLTYYFTTKTTDKSIEEKAASSSDLKKITSSGENIETTPIVKSVAEMAGTQQIIDELAIESLMKEKEEQRFLSDEVNRLLFFNDDNVLNELIPRKKRMRHKYPEDFKIRTVKLLDTFKSARKLCFFLNNHHPDTCDRLTSKMILDWKKKLNKSSNDVKKKKMGRPVCGEFEKEVFDECNLSRVKQSNSEQKVLVAADGTYTYDVIRQCAYNVYNRSYAIKNGNEISFHLKWQEHPLTKSLKFTNKWIWGALKRHMQAGSTDGDDNHDGNNDELRQLDDYLDNSSSSDDDNEPFSNITNKNNFPLNASNIQSVVLENSSVAISSIPITNEL